MALIPSEALRQIRRYRSRHVSPRRALRAAYRPVHERFVRYAPRLFDQEGQVFDFLVAGDESEVLGALRLHLVFTLDSALELTSNRRWSTDRDIWAYVEDLAPVLALVAAGLLRTVADDSGQGVASPDNQASREPVEAAVLLHCCVPRVLVPFVPARSGFRVVEADRLAEDLLGRHGLRLDLFARLLHLPHKSRS